MIHELECCALSLSFVLLELQESPRCSPCPQSSPVWVPPCLRCPTSRQWMCTCGSAPSLCFCQSLSMQQWITSPQWKSGSSSTGGDRYSFTLNVNSFRKVLGLVSFPVAIINKTPWQNQLPGKGVYFGSQCRGVICHSGGSQGSKRLKWLFIFHPTGESWEQCKLLPLSCSYSLGS